MKQAHKTVRLNKAVRFKTDKTGYHTFSVEEHYGVNRLHRRTVRGDIPVAKVVQSQEEIEQQKERLRKLAALQAQ